MYNASVTVVIAFARGVGGHVVSLVEAAAAEVVGDDDVGDGVEHELDVVGVRGARHVAVDLLGGRFVLGFELRLDIRRRFAVFLRACNTRIPLNKSFYPYCHSLVRVW